ncbi:MULTISPECIES: ATP synthase subunit I [Marinobacter]|nr:MULTISPECIES: ATP synthase subunit I [Marinobacter]MEC9039937.1 ATP synthase subunit I [Pseudomonadota bacterium]KAE8547249.1 ATP synthase protein I [Marinobacter nauticus]MBN8239927.1 ATP synthase subunit I [Marinobacter nauticus]MBW3197648.1 ATP synthase subunit I [Marinobacter nauticus]MBY6101689.1 ATP synthase subunit I [Marinobacter nauticus]
MNRSSRAITYVPLGKWLIIEMAVLLILSLLWLLESRLAGYSALIGGLIFVIPNAYFAHRAYRYQGARQMHLAVSNIFRAESIKLALTAVFFAAVFTLMEPVHVPALLFTFAVMVVLGTALRWLIRPRPQR